MSLYVDLWCSFNFDAWTTLIAYTVLCSLCNVAPQCTAYSQGTLDVARRKAVVWYALSFSLVHGHV